MVDLLWGDFKLGPFMGLPREWGLAGVAAPGQDWETVAWDGQNYLLSTEGEKNEIQVL